MPTSHPRQLNEIVGLILMTNPPAMLEIGIGFGKYGFLAREYLDIWGKEEGYGQRTHRIDGIEAFPQYVTPLQRQVYDDIFIGNAVEVLPTLQRKYDLILIVDVLEHFTREDGLALLDQCTKVASNVLIATPRHMLEQGDAFGNLYERHHYEWKRSDFSRYRDPFFPRNADSLICFFGEKSRQVRSVYRRLEVMSLTGMYARWALPLAKGLHKVARRFRHGRASNATAGH